MDGWICENCGEVADGDMCMKCGRERSITPPQIAEPGSYFSITGWGRGGGNWPKPAALFLAFVIVVPTAWVILRAISSMFQAAR
ncbi:MAG: hypothetical protein K8R88_09335 [Armatimonadetes bacterium]|nr:hypothetical protein [Armatimonadota bacterium]